MTKRGEKPPSAQEKKAPGKKAAISKIKVALTPQNTSIKSSTTKGRQVKSDAKTIKLTANANIKKLNTKSSKQTSLTYLVDAIPLPSGDEYLKLDLNCVQKQSRSPDELGKDKLAGRPHASCQFQDGFVVDEDQVPLAPYTWGVVANKSGKNTRSQAAYSPLVFTLLADPSDEHAPLKKKIATVRAQSPGENPLERDYSYKLFTYGDTSQESSLKYVFSGSDQSVIPGGHVVSNTFIPLEILRTRLCGNWKARKEAYTRDWLTFCNLTIQLELLKPRQDQRKLKDLIPESALPKDTEQVRGKLELYDGSHLLARDSAGLFSACFGAKFLYHLLMPAGEISVYPQNLAQHIFKRWCLVANIAASIEKEPFSVKARFWKIPKTPIIGNDFELIYEMLPDWWNTEASNLVLKNKTKLGDFFKNLNLKFDPDSKAYIDSQWEEFMKPIFQEALTSASFAPVQMPQIAVGKTVKPRLLSQKDKRGDLYVLGSHPQGYYRTYITKRDLNRMKDLGYTLGCSRLFPNAIHPDKIVLQSGLTPTINTDSYPVTTTSITKTNLRIAGNWPRIRTQNAVMGGVSANEIARRIWPDGLGQPLGQRPAEWLHRSAYSYGGNGSPDSSQEQENLVFGTFEANTEMIRYESYLKRMVNAVSEDKRRGAFEVTLNTVLNTSNSQLGSSKTLPWLVTQLYYGWSFDLNYAFSHNLLASQRQIQSHVVFDLFSQKHPMLFEIEVDEIFDKQLPNAPDVLRRAVALFLVCQSEIGGVRISRDSKL